MLDKFYDGNYKLYILVPVIIFIISLFFIGSVPKSIDLKGGTEITIYDKLTVSSDQLAKYLEENFGLKEVTIRTTKSLAGDVVTIQYITPEKYLELRNTIAQLKAISDDGEKVKAISNFLKNNHYDFNSTNAKDLEKELDNYYNEVKSKDTKKVLMALHNQFGLDIKKAQIKEIGAVLGEAFYSTAVKAAIWAAILVVIVIFLFFRELIPSVAVISAGIIDVSGALFGMYLFNVPLSLVTIPALLMLIGYSIDTDIMLTTRLLKRSGNNKAKAIDAMKTGLTMTSTTLAALLSMLVISYLYNVVVIMDIAIVLLSGLVIDIISTWMMNAPVLLWYLESKKK